MLLYGKKKPKNRLTGLPSPPGKPWEPGAPSLPCGGEHKYSTAFDEEAMRHSLPAQWYLQRTGGPVVPMPTGPCGPAGPTSPLEPYI